MPIPIIAALAIAAGSSVVAAGGTGIYFSTKYKKQIAELQDDVRQLQKELQESNNREKELTNRIAELEKQKLELISKIDTLTNENKANTERIALFEDSLKRNDNTFRKIIATLTLKLDKLKEENKALNEQIQYFTELVEINKLESQKTYEKVTNIDSLRQQSAVDLKSVQDSIAEKKCLIQDMEEEVRCLAK